VSATQFYLSLNATIDPSDILLGSRSVPSLASGASDSGSTTVMIPGDTSDGDWWIVAKADGQEVVPETVETNNLYVRSITIGSEADLNIAGLSASSTASPGNSLVITDTTRNIGAGVAGSTETQFYLSLNATIDPSDILLGSRSVPSLAAGSSSAGPTSVTIPGDTPVGNWYIVAKADGEEVVTESLESNNTYARAIAIGADVDLDITSMSSPTTAGAGSSITITETTKNIGDGVAGSTETQFYLSLNSTIDPSDILLGSRGVPSLAARTSSVGSTTATIPGNTDAGTWYIIAKADGEELVAESNENNNTYTRTIGIGPDLDVTSFRGPSSANPGQGITLSDSTKNRGAGVADQSLTQFYLSANGTLDPSDILLGSRSVPALAEGAVMIPVGTASQKWYLIAVADGEAVISETSESNNTYVRSINIR
jgi:subtilase family serine protease